jgi:hypothetical protein
MARVPFLEWFQNLPGFNHQLVELEVVQVLLEQKVETMAFQVPNYETDGSISPIKRVRIFVIIAIQ